MARIMANAPSPICTPRFQPGDFVEVWFICQSGGNVVPYKKFEQKQLRTLQQCPTVVPNIYSPTDTVFIKMRREGERRAVSKLKKVYGFAQLGCVTILMMRRRVSIRLHRTAPLSPRLWLPMLLEENTAIIPTSFLCIKIHNTTL